MTSLEDYASHGEHTHAQRVSFIVWALLACVVLLAALQIGLWSYLFDRASLADARNVRQRQAICAVLATIPGPVPPQIVTARRVFARPGHPHDCQTPPVSPRRPTPTPTVTVPATVRPGAPSPTVGATPTPTPTATRTIRPTSRPTPTATTPPHPSPSPTRSCTVHVGPVCV